VIGAIETEGVSLINDTGVNRPGWKDVGVDKRCKAAALQRGRRTVGARNFLTNDRDFFRSRALSLGAMIDGRKAKIAKSDRPDDESARD